jgi:hypothetical protein
VLPQPVAARVTIGRKPGIVEPSIHDPKEPAS